MVADRVMIDAVASGNVDALNADLQALGMQDVAVFGRTVSGRLPISAISALSGLAGLKIREARPRDHERRTGHEPGRSCDARRRGADGVRLDGTGVSVGVLSDSFNCLGGAAADVTSGDLSPVNVLQDLPGCGSATDEGRAMLQLVHDVAPGASLLFATAYTGQAGFASNILSSAAAGADVIVDDVIYFAEPMFQDGIIAQAVDAVVAAGVPYFSSAGNEARAAYQAGFVNSGINLGSRNRGTPRSSPTTSIRGRVCDIFQTVDLPDRHDVDLLPVVRSLLLRERRARRSDGPGHRPLRHGGQLSLRKLRSTTSVAIPSRSWASPTAAHRCRRRSRSASSPDRIRA